MVVRKIDTIVAPSRSEAENLVYSLRCGTVCWWNESLSVEQFGFKASVKMSLGLIHWFDRYPAKNFGSFSVGFSFYAVETIFGERIDGTLNYWIVYSQVGHLYFQAYLKPTALVFLNFTLPLICKLHHKNKME